MPVRFTKRRNGREMATLRIEIAVDRAEFDWLMQHGLVSLNQAARMIRDEARAECDFAWHTWAYKDGAIERIHIDDREQYEADGYDVF